MSLSKHLTSLSHNHRFLILYQKLEPKAPFLHPNNPTISIHSHLKLKQSNHSIYNTPLIFAPYKTMPLLDGIETQKVVGF